MEPKLQAATASILTVRLKHFCVHVQVNAPYLCSRFLCFSKVDVLNYRLHMTNNTKLSQTKVTQLRKEGKREDLEALKGILRMVH